MLASVVAGQEVVALPALPTFSNIVFLSSFDGLDFATSAVDRSVKNASITFFGTAHVDGLIKKYGTGSLSVGAGSGNGIRIPASTDYLLVDGNFTVEAYVYVPTSYSGTMLIAGVFGGGASISQSQWSFTVSNANFNFLTWGTFPENHFNLPHGMVGGQFYHVAACRTNSTLRIFVDGIMVGSVDFTVRSVGVPLSSVGLSIGSDWDQNINYPWKGNIDEVRITKGSWYRTDDSFTPPTAPYGFITPGLFVDTDTFYTARSSPYTLAPSRVVDADTFYAPRVSPQILRPTLVIDTDTFYTPLIKVATVFANVTNVTLSGNNLVATSAGGTSTDQGATPDSTGLRTLGNAYFEMTATSVAGAGYGFGIAGGGQSFPQLSTGVSGTMLFASGHVFSQAVDRGALFAPMADGDVYGIVANMNRHLLWFKKVSGTPSNWNGDPLADPLTLTGGFSIPTGTVLPCCTFGGTGGVNGKVITGNFGQAAFIGAVPAGSTSGWLGDS